MRERFTELFLFLSVQMGHAGIKRGKSINIGLKVTGCSSVCLCIAKSLANLQTNGFLWVIKSSSRVTAFKVILYLNEELDSIVAILLRP